VGKVIAVASGKGGTGKTTTVAAVSSCLAALGYKTLSVDFDIVLRNLDLALCMTDYAVADFMDVVSKKLDLMEACHESAHIPKLYFLAAPTTSFPEGAAFAPTAYEQDAQSIPDILPMFAEIRNEFDYCIIDSPSGIGSGFRLAHAGADMSLIVTTGELPAMRDAQMTAGVIRDMGIDDIRLLVNRVLHKNIKWLHTTIDDIINTVGVQLIGVIPEDPAVFKALHDNVPLILYQKRRAAYDFLDVARRITGENIPTRRR